MDFNKLVTRAKNILFTPKTEWAVIAEEPATVGGIYTGYVMILAAIPAVISFLSVLMISRLFGLGGAGVVSLIVSYALGLGLLYLLAIIADALAPSFGGQRNLLQAFKLCAYSYTASWVGSLVLIVPLLGFLVWLVALGYGFYILYLGVPHTTKVPEDKAAGYTVVLVLLAIVMAFIANTIVGLIIGGSMMMGGGSRGLGSSVQQNDASQTFDEDSALGKLEQFGKSMEEAGKKMEAAQKSGDSQAQNDALKNMMGTVLSGGAAGTVEALPPDRLKEFVPASLAGLGRHSIEVSRNNALGVQVSEAKASFEMEGEPGSLHLEITDAGGAKAMLGLASWAAFESEKETQGGYEKTYRENDRMIHEKWDAGSSTGEYAMVIADRFTVELRGKTGSMKELKEAFAELDLAGLEALKNEGVKAQ